MCVVANCTLRATYSQMLPALVIHENVVREIGKTRVRKASPKFLKTNKLDIAIAYAENLLQMYPGKCKPSEMQRIHYNPVTCCL